MDSQKTMKLLKNLKSGLITDLEVANDWLYDAISNQNVEASIKEFQDLPVAVQSAIYKSVNQIKQNGFQWHLFMVSTTGGNPPILLDAPFQRRLCESILEISKGETGIVT